MLNAMHRVQKANNHAVKNESAYVVSAILRVKTCKTSSTSRCLVENFMPLLFAQENGFGWRYIFLRFLLCLDDDKKS